VFLYHDRAALFSLGGLPTMRTDPLPTFAYRLEADNTTIGYLKQARFPSLHVFEFEAPLLMDQRFVDSVSNHGYLPFHHWSLITFNTALQETGRIIWNQARVTRVRFPELTRNSSAPLRIVVQMAVGGVREVALSERSTTGTASALSRRADPSPLFAVEWTIDGLGSTFDVSKVDAFWLGDGASDGLVLTVTPEASADLFRNWLGSGNAPRGGSLRMLDNGLQVVSTLCLTGLRVRSVMPAVSLHASLPAIVRLTYAEIRFEGKK
jgi:hypothetical protein